MSPHDFLSPLERIFSSYGLPIVGGFLVLFALGGRIPALRFLILVVGLIYFLTALNVLPKA